MNKSTSLYLDFLRVIAAFGVMMVHANQVWFSNGLFLAPEFGHKLVMIFFVLSGYLIAFTVDKKDKGPERYLVDRTSRLYSVVVPALILTAILDSLGQKLNPTFYLDKVNAGNQVFRVLLNATFLQQVWGLCTRPFTNTPFWSIGYEFWYYIIFWLLCYFKGTKRAVGLLAVCAITGPKILILFPVWIFGALAYKYSAKIKLSNNGALILFVATIALIWAMTHYPEQPFLIDKFTFGKAPLYFSSNFIFDWIYGFLIALNLFSMSYLGILVKVPGIIERAIKYCSSITFSLYLYHGPMLIFCAAVIHYNKSSYVQTIAIICGVLLTVAALSQITEKQRNVWKRLFEWVFVRQKTKPVVTNE